VRQREFEALGGELLDVWTADILGLFNLNDLDDLKNRLAMTSRVQEVKRMCVPGLIGNGHDA
jgi:hypothetical protein